MMAPREKQEDGHHLQQQLRALAARAVTDSLRSSAAADAADERARRYRDCVRSLEAEKAKMEVFRRELPISVHLVADVIEWLKEELARHRRAQPAPPPADLLAPPAASPAAPLRPAAAKDDEADANDKRSWMSSAQLWSHDDSSTANTNHKASSAFMPTTLATLPTLARTSPGKPTAMPGVPDLSLSSPAAAAPSAASSAVTDAAGAQRQQQQQQRKARRCWSPELHRRFVAALQRLGGAQVATPKQIRELMKVDGLTNDEVKSHLQKYRLHTRRGASSSDGGGEQLSSAAGLWSSSAAAAEQQQYTTSQHSTSQSGSPQGPLQLTVSSRATAGDSCDGDEAEGGKSESCGGWEMMMHRRGTTKASSS